MTDREFKENPYAVEAAAIEPSVDASPYNGLSWRRAAWGAVVLINLPIPLMFGMSVCKAESVIGMPIGILIVLLTGLWCCRGIPKAMSMLNSGAVVTALSQFWPMAHIMIGSVAVRISQMVFDRDANSGNLTGVVSTTSATLLTGAGLILLSFIFGAILMAFASIFRRR
jgi:hypothetical protein